MASIWVLLSIIAIFTLPILYGIIRDFFGWNNNKFYGDEMNKKKNKKNITDKVYEKNSYYW
ncbi:hypothetical protein GH741_12645 [Aquibacillus halophilus]|uniref:Uncharacterized protein n=1 Tax=Aquibacillus halophilus TaxID=930132 RepID=A0A6A8DCY3_9BACI|nr:hypothetical protein [Aquibacillus halophilus]MRH43528.1 hypothetical protein [Aquibacillus halophilus]